MKYFLICLGLLLVVSGCTTKVVSPSLPCKPPGIVMEKAKSLPKINSNILSMREMYKQMLDDASMYDDLRSKDNTLIDWVNNHCQ